MSSETTTQPVLSVLIVSWNAQRVLQRCLASIFAESMVGLEVIVVDNGSVDDTVPLVQVQFPQVRLVTNSVNLGLPRAVNHGLTLAQGDYVMLLDSDTELRSGALAGLLHFMTEHPEVSVVARHES